MKALSNFALMAGAFFAVWFGLREVDWKGIFGIKTSRISVEHRLGDTMWETIRQSTFELKGDTTINRPVEKILERLCAENNIDKDEVKLHIIDEKEVNAFALPGGHLVINLGLLKECRSESELAGVIGHELAHQQKKHVMKKLVKEVGFGALANMAGGKNGAAARKIAETVSSTAYDRKLESEADATSVEYLLEAGADPNQFGEFLYRLSLNDEQIPEVATWLSTHPGSAERAETIDELLDGKTIKLKPILSSSEWRRLKEGAEEWANE